MDELIQKLLTSIKKRLSIVDETQDDLIQEEIEDFIVEVLEYCNLKVLPRALEPFIKRKVVAYIKSGVTGINGEWDEQVKSITRGDVTTTMLAPKERLLEQDLQILDKFKDRKVRVR